MHEKIKEEYRTREDPHLRCFRERPQQWTPPFIDREPHLYTRSLEEVKRRYKSWLVANLRRLK